MLLCTNAPLPCASATCPYIAPHHTGSTPRTERGYPTCIFSTPTHLELGICHCDRYQSGSGLCCCTNSPFLCWLPHVPCPYIALHHTESTSRIERGYPDRPLSSRTVLCRDTTAPADTGGVGLPPPLVVPGSLTGPGRTGQAWETPPRQWLRPPGASQPPLGFGHPGKPQRTNLRVRCGMRRTNSAHTMVRRATLRVIICRMSCTLDAHMLVPRRTLLRVSCTMSCTHDSHMMVRRTTLRERCKMSYCIHGTRMMIRRTWFSTK